MAKKKVTVTLDQDTVDWIEEEIENNERFSSVSHAIRHALKVLKNEREVYDIHFSPEGKLEETEEYG